MAAEKVEDIKHEAGGARRFVHSACRRLPAARLPPQGRLMLQPLTARVGRHSQEIMINGTIDADPCSQLCLFQLWITSELSCSNECHTEN